MSAVTFTIAIAGLFLAVAGGTAWKLGRCFLADPMQAIPGGQWIISQPDQACLLGLVLLLSAGCLTLLLKK
jgi:hypothetical protein